MRPTLYVLTPDGWTDERLLDTTRELLTAAPEPGWLQYRDKSLLALEARLATACALRALCHACGWKLLVNDHVEIAVAAGADGVHLGAQDGALTRARVQLGPGSLLGSSCYDSLERAQAAATAGADYLAFGAFFPSTTKPLARRATPDLLAQARVHGLPLCAIGGITVHSAGALVTAGADLVAVLDAVYGAADPTIAVRALQSAIARGAAAR